MADDEGKLRALEGFGYLAAFMIGVGGLMEVEALRYFNILGLVFGIIVLVRLLVMNITLGLAHKLYDAQLTDEADSLDAQA